MADSLLTGQDISDLSGSILRLDVDHSSSRQLVSIPLDNPFVGKPNARGEIWSFGHRNVWKFNFDSQNRLWAGDVGQDLWEAIYLIEKGGNYGWSIASRTHRYLGAQESKTGISPVAMSARCATTWAPNMFWESQRYS